MKYILIISILTSCSARWHVRQAEKHLRKAEFKGAQVKYDTIFIQDTVVTERVIADTVFKSEVGDTVFLEKEKLRIKYVKLPGDSVFIEGECKPDTIVKMVPITVTREISAGKSWMDIILWAGFGFIIGFLIGFIAAVITWKHGSDSKN